MSITTKTGDAGTTGLMYGRRVLKHDERLETFGAVDELSASLGMARAAAGSPRLAEQLLTAQKDLVGVMGELATLAEDRARYRNDGYAVLAPSATAGLEARITELEGRDIAFSGWAMAGGNLASAALDLARTTCRRAERRVSALRESDPGQNPEILVYLNRLSDLLWLLAREAEHETGQAPAAPNPGP